MVKLDRNSSICPSPEDTLLQSVLKNDCATVRTVLQDNGNLFDHTYPFPYENSIIFIACSEEGVNPNTVETLIELGADLHKVNIHTPLICAALNPNIEILKLILKKINPGEINKTNPDGNTALLELIKSDEIEEDEDVYVEHVELLLRNGIDVNKTDNRNMSPILWAAKKGLRQIVETIIEKSIGHVDLDSHQCPLNKKTARQLIREKDLFKKPLPEKMMLSLNLKEKLFASIKEGKQEEFVQTLNSSSDISRIINETDGNYTLLQYACEKGLFNSAKLLIDKQADVNLKGPSGLLPLELAANYHHLEIFDLLLIHNASLSAEVLPRLIKTYRNQSKDSNKVEKCLRNLLESLKKSTSKRNQINEKDKLGNTPLHYAVKYADADIVQALLDLGASLACKNDFNRLDVEDMDPEILELHLNSCIKSEDNNTQNVIFDYSSLLPPPLFEKKLRSSENDLTVTERKPLEDDPEKAIKERKLQPETEIIAYMSKSKDFKHLLVHPVIVTFLFMKWHKIRHIYYTNFTFSIVFVLSLLAYIFTRYLNPENDNNSWGVIFQGVVIVSFVILFLRELFQITVSPQTYLKNVENYIEVALIIVTGMVLFSSSSSEDSKKILASIAILLAALELFLMVGHHPKLSTNVVMLETVSANFFELLLWYSLLIAAFALSFSILLAKEEGKPGDDDDVDQFAGTTQSIFKTIVMLTGEFDASSINFETYPIWSKFIFILFVFMITIILLNLLNGLAVSDTQSIKNDAELVGHISRAQHVNYVENMAMGNIFPSSVIRFVSNLCCCLNPLPYARVGGSGLAGKVCLFRENPRFYIELNSGYISHVNEKFSNEEKNNQTCSTGCMRMKLDKETFKRMNGILKERNREGKTKSDQIAFDELKNKLDKIMAALERLDPTYNGPPQMQK